jgi:hypothetical protein
MNYRINIPTFERACAVLGIKPREAAHVDGEGIKGYGWFELRNEDSELLDLGVFANLVTNKGDQYYAERAAGIASPPGQVTGMQLGSGTTAVAKTGAGAAIVTLVASSLVAIDAGFPTSNGLKSGATACRIQWKTTWPAGTATATGIAEVVLVNQATGTQTAAPASATISRALLSPTVNKGASDTLAVTWNHDLLGA